MRRRFLALLRRAVGTDLLAARFDQVEHHLEQIAQAHAELGSRITTLSQDLAQSRLERARDNQDHTAALAPLPALVQALPSLQSDLANQRSSLADQRSSLAGLESALADQRAILAGIDTLKAHGASEDAAILEGLRQNATAMDDLRRGLDHVTAQQAVDVAHLKATLNLLGRRAAVPAKPTKVLFIVHFAQNWATLEPIYSLMASAPDFEPVVVSVDYAFVGGPAKDGEGEIHDLLARLNIPHLRWKAMSDPARRHLLRYLAPDIVFRQTAWDGSVSQELQTAESAFARICYIPYHLDLVEGDFTINLEMHHAAWRIFLPSARHVRFFQENSLVGAFSARAVGHMGMDRTLQKRHEQVAQGGREAGQRYTILWAPHHSLGANWLGFGTFVETWRRVVQFAKDHADINIVLRAHHLLFQHMAPVGNMSEDEIEAFKTEWACLPNTSSDTSADYTPVFLASDVLLTDGISFLAEYQVTGQPIVYLERPGHLAFNDVGLRVVEGTYTVATIDDAFAAISRLKQGGDDPLKTVRAAITDEFVPYPGQTAARILDDIRQGLKDD